MVVKKTTKNDKKRQKYCCKLCDFISCKKTDYIRHTSTDKHKKHENDSKMVVNDSEKTKKSEKMFTCHCGKVYKYDSGLYRHKKICLNEPLDKPSNTQQVDSLITSELIIELIKDNKEMKQLIGTLVSEQNNTINTLVKNGITNTNISNNTNCNNKTFNLQVFLNETCKDAMNLTDFIDSIKLELSDFEKVGELGYVEGISNIITTNLKALDITKRPVHCTDKKRETFYIKDQDKWEKDENKSNLKKVISKVSSKNSRLMSQFRDKYPECRKSESRISDKFNKMVIEAMGGLGDNNTEKEEKIIRNISKATTIEKHMGDL